MTEPANNSGERPSGPAGPETTPKTARAGDQVAGAGRGAVAIAGAKFYFLLAGWALYFSLPRILSEQLWGDYLLIVGLVSVVNNVVVSGTIQAVSRFTAQNEARAAAIRWAAVRMHGFLGVGAAVLFAGVGAALSYWWKDPGLSPLFALVSVVIVLYSFYSIFVGSANGQRQFVKQASLDIGYATIKLALVLGGAYVFFKAGSRHGVAGALGGMVAAAGTIFLVSVVAVGVPSRKKPVTPVGPLTRYAVELFVFTFVLNLLMRVDLILIKKMGVRLASGTSDAAAFASTLAARYGTAQIFAFIPFQLLLALAFVIFPLLSRSTFEQDHETTRSYIRQTLRLTLIVAAGLAAVFASMPEAIISVVYQDAYRAGGVSLRNLSWGIGCMSMMVIGCTILNASGKTLHAIAAVVLSALTALGANWIALSTAETGGQALARAGLATAAAMALGMVFTLFMVHRIFRATLGLLSTVRTVGCAAATVAAGSFLPEGGKMLTVAYCAGLVLLFGLLLVVTRELKMEDLARLKSVFRRKKG